MTPLRCTSTASAARSFVQIAKRRYCNAAASSTSAHLDFLIPSNALRSAANAATRAQGPSKLSVPFISSSSLQSTRRFSTTTVRSATVCVQNPQTDEDGNEMTLEITARAAKVCIYLLTATVAAFRESTLTNKSQRLSQIMTKDANPNLALRIQVESGGCHGFQYLMSLVTIPSQNAQETSSIVSEEDTIFEYVADDAASAPAGENTPKIILDEPSLDLLKGSKVDFTMELIGSQFKIVDNPLATSSCGCGTSFDIKM